MNVIMQDVSVSFGGNLALNQVSLSLSQGAITGLIGPNGAGKSTVINVLSGFLRVDQGMVVADSREITKRSVQARAHLGIGRTFQQVKLCEESTVMENLLYAAEAFLVGSNPVRLVLRRRGEESRIKERVMDAMETCHLTAVADSKVEDLSTGQRRLVELSRCIVNEYRIVLLDEPAAGLDEYETKILGGLLKQLVAQKNIGVLLVEHDMSLVLNTCDIVYVLDFGKIVFAGSCLDARSSRVVQDAYLGVA